MDEAGPNPIYREYVARLRSEAARDETDRAMYWANASPDVHAEVLSDLLDFADMVIRARGRPAAKAPLPEDSFPWPSLRMGT